ncbi:hypothetical protein [Corynebacterium bovis]|uniref:hypothetical protein n=1 Tax=Corynebacterium bovis TaxID=36808 RepID=UPI000F6515D6|nr:hypothetical protein [Corynebacterium bovis]
MGILRGFCVAVITLSVLFFGSGVASADPGQNDFQKDFAKCKEEHGGPAIVNKDLDRWVIEKLPDPVQGAIDNVNCTLDSGADHPLDAVAAGVGNAASKFWGDPVGKFAKSVIEGNQQALEMVMTFWMDFDMGKALVEDNSTGVVNIMWYVILGACVINMIIVGTRMVWLRRQGVADGIEEIGGVFWNMALYSVVLPAGIFSAIGASDVLSHAILDQFGASDADSFLEGVNFADDQAGPVVMLFIAGLAFVGSCVQFLAMVARVLILPVLIGLMPLFAGLSATDWGRQGLNSGRNWLIALVLYKPLAAIFYCVAFWVHNSQGDGIVWTAVRGLAVGLAGFSILSLAKVIVPGMASMGGANSGTAGAAMGMATGAVAAGAMAGIGGVAGGVGKAATGAGRALSASGGAGKASSSSSRAATGAKSATTGGGGGGGASPTGQDATATGAASTTGAGAGAEASGGGAGASGAAHSTNAAGGAQAPGGAGGGAAGTGAVATTANTGSGGGAGGGQDPAGGQTSDLSFSGTATGGSTRAAGSAGDRGSVADRARGVAGAGLNRVGAAGSATARRAAAMGRIMQAAGRSAGEVARYTGAVADDSIGSAGHPGHINR